MNIAYLILAHNQPLLLKRLMERLNQPNVSFYIHIDKKTKNIDFFKSLLAPFNNATIISTREVNWMGYTTIEAELDLLSLAFGSGIPFKYFVLMSGQDYPIKSNKYINNFFSTHNTDFLSYSNLNFISQEMREKLTLYHFRDIPFINPRNPKKIPFLVYLYFGAHRHLKKIMPERKFYKNFEPFFGSQWFAFTHDTVGYILNFVKNNPGYVTAMKHTDGPDEMFFHTIILNSERRNNVYDYDRYLDFVKTVKEKDVFKPGFSSLRYMDWSEKAKSKPAVLDMDYYEILKGSKELFARKVDENTSLDLLNKIDDTLLNAD